MSPRLEPADTASLCGFVGRTPLLDLSDWAPDGVQLWAKAEYLNPSGSVKDRAARAMILDGIASGRLTKDRAILDATSGNTGIAYATLGAALGYRVVLCIPKNANFERKRVLTALGATLVETDPLAGSDGALVTARDLAARNPDAYFYPDQYNNDANWRAHYETTAPEIWEQTGGTVSHFVAGMGTSGTFVGTVRRLRELAPSLRAVAMQPESPLHGLEGMKHMKSTIVPGIYDPDQIDDTVEIATEDAWEWTRRLARDRGLFVGVSSGGNVHAALLVAQTAPRGSVVVTILCDSGFRYLSDPFWGPS